MWKVALTDDHTLLRNGLAGLVNSFPNFTVMLEANNGKDLMQKIDPMNLPDIILVDINMPQMNGLEMVERLKKNPKTASIPICMLTTETGSEELLRAKSLGVNAFLVKPIKKEQILAVVNGLLAAR